MKSVIAITSALIGFASAQSVSSWVDGHWPDNWGCKSECNAWVNNVADCVGNLNMTYSASINTGDVSSFQMQGDWSALGQCLCDSSAIGVSDSCISCVNDAWCLKPALTVSDYQNSCQNPQNGWQVWQRYHKMSQCSSTKPQKPQKPSGSNQGGQKGGNNGGNNSQGGALGAGNNKGGNQGSGSQGSAAAGASATAGAGYGSGNHGGSC